MGENSKKHVMEMIQSGDEDHKAAIESMQQLSKEEQEKWYEDFKQSFDTLSDA
jgi:arginyl-tRNA synthetase